jgi:hypothetical protein
MTYPMRWVARLLIIVLASFYAVLIGLALLSDRLIFQAQPSSCTDESLSDSVTGAHDGRLMHIMSGDQRITAIYLSNPEAKAQVTVFARQRRGSRQRSCVLADVPAGRLLCVRL